MKRLLLLLLVTLLPIVASAYDAYIDGIYYNLSGNEAEVTYGSYQYSGSVVIPESVTSYIGKTYSVKSIGHDAFNQSALTSITIPSSVTSIGACAFYGCSGLTSIRIPYSVTSIEMAAFSNCNGLTSIYVHPDNIKYDSRSNSNAIIETATKKLLVGCKSTIIPNGITSIDGYSFYECSSLSHITIPESVTSINNMAFYGCYFVSDSFINNSMLTSDNNWGATLCDVETNSGLLLKDSIVIRCRPWVTSVAIPEDVTSIGYRAFYFCRDLISVNIPTSITYIGKSAFQDCSSLTDVWCYAENVPTTESNAFLSFGYQNISSATLHVPAASVETYSSTNPWSNFGVITSIKNTLIYIVDGEVYKMYEIEYGSSITPEPVPTREGYTFSGWSEIPATMPAEDVTVIGSFAANSYAITYIVDGNIYKTDSIAFGTEISPEPVPTKEGYTFSGWSVIPATMPAEDVVITGTFTINSYTITYIVDGEEYKTSTIVYGSEITPEEEPTKEGYTFSGWSEIPETMPAEDVVVTGTFIVKSYALTYIVDGEEYKTDSIAYGVAITAEEEPFMEGYTFSGWSEIPETMPAEDVTVTGSFTINQYLLTYVIDGEEYKSYDVDYNATLTPEPAPTKRGMTFSGWGEVPETMPAHDLTLTGTYSWAQETIDGVIYQVTDTLSNYASVIGTEDASEVTILTDVMIDEYCYTVNNIEDNALPKTATINVSVGRLLLWLWKNGYEDIKEAESGRSLSAPEVALVSSTASSLTLSYVNDYPELSETVTVLGSPIEKGENEYEIVLKGLEPDNLYEAYVTLNIDEGSYTKSFSFSTEPLTLVALQPKVVSLGNVVVAANSNLDDEETNVGFEWRRIDWTDEFTSNSGIAYLYDGTMEGYIRNLYTEKLWKYRPFYQSDSGNRYYGEWVGIDPSDYSYFEPTIHTYAPIAVTDSTAEVKGYVMQGTDDVESQGFKYWTTSSASSRRKVNGVPVDAAVVEVSGHVMKTTLAGLDYDTEYCFVAFVKNENGETFYGEMQSFRTNSDPDSIEDIKASEEVTEVARYDIQGRMIGKPQKGINIIRYSDGTSRKVLVK